MHDGNLLFDYLDRIADRPAVFVNVGAHNGYPYENGRGDPLVPYIRRGKWRGIAFEPMPAIFAELEANLRGVPGVTLVNAAVAGHDGEVDIHSVSEEDTGWAFAAELNSIVPDRGYVARVPDRVSVTTVPCLTLPTVFDRHRIARCDVLKIDTEGAEAQILRPLLEARDTVMPKLIYYEDRHLPEEERTDLIPRLESRGYTVIEQRRPWDTIAVRPDFDRFNLLDRVRDILRRGG